VLSTLALALMIQQVAAIKWGTEPQPFPRLIGLGSGVWDEKFWLPVVACAITIVGLEYLYRRTLVGRAFVAIAEDISPRARSACRSEIFASRVTRSPA